MTVTPESVSELLHSEDFGQRLRAVNQIRQLEPAIAFPMLQTAAADSNPRVRYAAVSQFSSLGQQDRAVTLTILRDRLLHDDDPDVQAAAADSIGALKLTDAFEDLQFIYRTTTQWLVRFSIVAALGELGDVRGFELLETALQSDNELVRTAAVGSLGELGDARALPLLIPFATDQDWQIRYRVVQALGHFNHPEAQSILETLSQDAVESVAQEARNSLGS